MTAFMMIWGRRSAFKLVKLLLIGDSLSRDGRRCSPHKPTASPTICFYHFLLQRIQVHHFDRAGQPDQLVHSVGSSWVVVDTPAKSGTGSQTERKLKMKCLSLIVRKYGLLCHVLALTSSLCNSLCGSVSAGPNGLTLPVQPWYIWCHGCTGGTSGITSEFCRAINVATDHKLFICFRGSCCQSQLIWTISRHLPF